MRETPAPGRTPSNRLSSRPEEHPMIDRLMTVALWPAWCVHTTLCGLAVAAIAVADTIRSTR